MLISSRTGSGMPHRLSAAVDCAWSILTTGASAGGQYCWVSRITCLVSLDLNYLPYHLPWRALSSAQNESTFVGSMILVGTIISLLAGMKDLSPSRYLAISFIP